MAPRPPAFVAQTFPTSDMRVYAHYEGGTFFFNGLSETDVHLTSCGHSTCLQIESGGMVAGKLVSHAQLLADSGSDTNQLTQAGQASTGPVA